MEETRLLIAGIHRLFRESLAHFLDSCPDIKTVGQTRSAQETLAAVPTLNPDILIIDSRLPEIGGLETVRRLISRHPEVKIIALSDTAVPHHAWQMINMGVAGCLLTSAPLKELIKTIRGAARGELYLSPEIAGSMAKAMAERSSREMRLNKLSSREKEILQLIAEGYKPKQIAKKLYISPKTVQIHQASLKKKLNLTTTADLTKYAVVKGITPLDILSPHIPNS